MDRMSRAISIPISALIMTVIAISVAILAGAILLSRTAPYVSEARAGIVAAIEPWTADPNGGILSISIINMGNVELTIRRIWLEGPGSAGCPPITPNITLKPGGSWSTDTFMPCIRKMENYVVVAELASPTGYSVRPSVKVVWKVWEERRSPAL